MAIDMTIDIVRIDLTNTRLFERIADDVFDEPVRSDRLTAYLRQANHLLLLAVETSDRDAEGRPLVVGQCAAVLHLHPDKPTELYVDELGTASSHRRQGIGRKLMQAMFVWGREHGCAESWLGTELDNLPARALYEALSEVESSTATIYQYEL
jgi:aminoglycoside 6'-N-acetyltransferase I